ncbi:MAG: toll/interleukin-1 receptor domain-containing protein [Candidatus Angelobacter sp.]
MDVFISWSGERSRAAAEALRGWLPKIINAIKPWLSSADIDKGARWGTDVASRLEAAKAGIICLTPSNLHSDWILFEAGALSKTLQNTYVCPFLIGLEPSDVKQPLAQFQATRAVEGEVLKLLKTLNKALGDLALGDEHIKEAFDVWWPKLEAQLLKLPEDEAKAKTHRPDRELLEEILSLVRNQAREADIEKPHPMKSIIQSAAKKLRESTMRQETEAAVLAAGKTLESIEGVDNLMIVSLDDGNMFGLEIPNSVATKDLHNYINSEVTKALDPEKSK